MPCEKSLTISFNNPEDTIYKGTTYQGAIVYPLASYLVNLFFIENPLEYYIYWEIWKKNYVGWEEEKIY